jgi:hypothetical protein
MRSENQPQVALDRNASRLAIAIGGRLVGRSDRLARTDPAPGIGHQVAGCRHDLCGLRPSGTGR